jgi:D-alanyl-D-alanine carboxypeptidase
MRLERDRTPRESWSYSGEVWTGDDGRAVVVLPPYVRAHRAGFDYELTPVCPASSTVVAEEIVDHIFTIESDEPHVKIAWRVTPAARAAGVEGRPEMTKGLARLAASTLLVAVAISAPGAFSAVVVMEAPSTHRVPLGNTEPTAVRDPATHPALRKLLASAVSRAQAPGGVLLVKTPRWGWRGRFGVARLARSYGTDEVSARVPMPANGRFRVGSITKTFTATLVLRLVEAGVISLDDTVERWLPGRLPDGAGALITVRNLLQHRSGLQDAPFIFAGLFSVAGPPGTFYYANANYALLGEIVAAATDSSYEQQLRTRVLDPLGLTRTEVARGPVTPAGLVHGYSPKPATPHGLRIDETSWTDSTSAAAASIVSDAADLARFESALFTGMLIPRAQVALMQTPGSLEGFDSAGYTAYGLGLMRFPTRCGEAWGHRGTAFGYTAYMLSTKDASRSVVLLLNDGLLPDDTVRKLNPFVERALCSS